MDTGFTAAGSSRTRRVRKQAASARRRFWALELGLVATFVVSLVTVVAMDGIAHANPEFPAFVSSPSAGPPGTAITGWATGCYGESGGELSLTRVGSRDPIASVPIGGSDQDGWTATLTVPANASPGEYLVGAVCAFEQGTPNVYEANGFTVTTPATPGRLRVLPTSVSVGDEFTVTGTGCLGPGGAIAAIAENGTETEGAQVGTPDAHGDWSVAFTFPPGFVNPDSNYTVTAACWDGPDRVRFAYEDVPIDVTLNSAPPPGDRATGDPTRSGAKVVFADATTTTTSPGPDHVRLAADDADTGEAGDSPLPWLIVALLGGTGLGLLAVVRHRHAG